MSPTLFTLVTLCILSVTISHTTPDAARNPGIAAGEHYASRLTTESLPCARSSARLEVRCAGWGWAAVGSAVLGPWSGDAAHGCGNRGVAADQLKCLVMGTGMVE